MAPKTILYMSPSVRLLGARQSLLALVRSLDPQRYRPIVCCQAEGALTEELHKSGIATIILHTGWWRKSKYWPKIPFVLMRLRGIIKRENVALIHCNEIYPNPFAIAVGKWTKTPVLTHMRLSVTPQMTQKYYLHHAERIIVVSEAAGHDFDHWPDKSRKVVVIYNGVDPEKYQTSRPRAEIRKEFGWGEHEFIVGQIATWAHRKRQHIAVEALSKIADRLPHVKLVLVGGAAKSQIDYEAELRSLIFSLKLQDRVQLLPFTNDIGPVYNAIDLNLLISGDEGFGRTIIEAGSVGVPTIGAMAGGIPEIIRNDETGWLIPVDDPNALAAKMEQLAQDPEAVNRAGQAVREFVVENFSIQKHARQVQALYGQVLSERAEKGQAKK